MPSKKKEVKTKKAETQKKESKVKAPKQKVDVATEDIDTSGSTIGKLEMPVVDHLKVIKVIGEKGDAFHCVMEDNSTRYVEKNKF